jgi:glycosyltransferase involved in cell wall biosynthesis
MDTKIRLHLLALPHTITNDDFSHCAFTGKVLRFSPMMRSVGYEVYHYGVETSTSGADKDINLLTKEEWADLRKKSYKYLHKSLTDEEVDAKLNDHTAYVGDLANWSTPLYWTFNERLRKALENNYRSMSTDIVCITFGPAHEDALRGKNYLNIETGIGYVNAYKDFRIYESYTMYHFDISKMEDKCKNYWFVAPNYYNTLEFPLNLNPDNKKIGFFGRINDLKGANIIVEIAKRFPNISFILCGQGNPTPYLHEPNITYMPPITGMERGKYLGSLTALLTPTKFVEPFCGVSVEAQLCGTPVISTHYGAFVENIENFKTGVRCHTLADYCYGVQMALDGKFDRQYIHDRAVKLFDMYNVAKTYDYIFRTILEITNGNNGWYSKNCFLDNLQNK